VKLPRTKGPKTTKNPRNRWLGNLANASEQVVPEEVAPKAVPVQKPLVAVPREAGLAAAAAIGLERLCVDEDQILQTPEHFRYQLTKPYSHFNYTVYSLLPFYLCKIKMSYLGLLSLADVLPQIKSRQKK
jgi:hypothetical protein